MSSEALQKQVLSEAKKVKPEIIEGLLDRFFGKLATGAASRAIKNIKKKDPELGKLLKVPNEK